MRISSHTLTSQHHVPPSSMPAPQSWMCPFSFRVLELRAALVASLFMCWCVDVCFCVCFVNPFTFAECHCCWVQPPPGREWMTFTRHHSRGFLCVLFSHQYHGTPFVVGGQEESIHTTPRVPSELFLFVNSVAPPLSWGGYQPADTTFGVSSERFLPVKVLETAIIFTFTHSGARNLVFRSYDFAPNSTLLAVCGVWIARGNANPRRNERPLSETWKNRK